jgi:hypothetical protein
MRTLSRVGLAVLGTFIAVSTVSAQARPRATATPATRQAAAAQSGFWELGTDASLTVGLEDPKFIMLRIPGGALRAGYFTTPKISIEPTLTWLSVGQEDQTGFTTYQIGTGVLFHRTADRTRSQVYLRPFLAITGGSGGGGSSLTLGGGVGLKRPWMAGRLALRGEANIAHNDAGNGTLLLGGLLGVSVYTR